MCYEIKSFAHHQSSAFIANTKVTWDRGDPWEEQITYSLKNTYAEAIDEVKKCFRGFRCVNYVQIYKREGESKSLLKQFDRNSTLG